MNNRMTLESFKDAVYHGNLEMALRYVIENPEEGYRLNECSDRGDSALNTAAARGDFYFVQAFLQAGADPDKPGRYGCTPLIMACSANTDSPDCVRALLKAGANPDKAKHDSCGPLFYAARYGQIGSLRELLKAGAKPHVINQYGLTALTEAANKNQIDCICELLMAGAQIIYTAPDGTTWSAIEVAEEQGHGTAAEIIRNVQYIREVYEFADSGKTALAIQKALEYQKQGKEGVLLCLALKLLKPADTNDTNDTNSKPEFKEEISADEKAALMIRCLEALPRDFPRYDETPWGCSDYYAIARSEMAVQTFLLESKDSLDRDEILKQRLQYAIDGLEAKEPHGSIARSIASQTVHALLEREGAPEPVFMENDHIKIKDDLLDFVFEKINEIKNKKIAPNASLEQQQKAFFERSTKPKNANDEQKIDFSDFGPFEPAIRDAMSRYQLLNLAEKWLALATTPEKDQKEDQKEEVPDLSIIFRTLEMVELPTWISDSSLDMDLFHDIYKRYAQARSQMAALMLTAEPDVFGDPEEILQKRLQYAMAGLEAEPPHDEIARSIANQTIHELMGGEGPPDEIITEKGNAIFEVLWHTIEKLRETNRLENQPPTGSSQFSAS